MKQIVVFLYIFVTSILGIATVFEALYGTPFISTYCYQSSWFFALWTVLGIWGGIYLFKRKLWKRPAAILLHTALIVILIGAGITWIWGEKGIMHIREGETQQNFVQTNDTILRPLPFQLQLNAFNIAYYPGTETPTNYESIVSVIDQSQSFEQTISMNNILSYKGYRFYQSSFDEDKKGTWLSVNHDPIGIGVTYTGYVLLVIAMLFVLISKKCGFRKLLNHPILQKSVIALAMVFIVNQNELFAQETEKVKPIWNREVADSAASIQILYNGRIAAFNTLARDFTTKLYGKPSYKGLSAEQVIGSWLLFPESWANEPMILIKDDKIRQELGITGKYARYIDFFDTNGTYKLKTLWEQSHTAHTNEQPSALQKAITQVDEKVALITMLQQGELIQKLPATVTPLPQSKIVAEIWYNKIPFCKILFMVNLTIGIFAFLFLCVRILKHILNTDTKIYACLQILLFLSLLFLTVCIGLRWYICGRIPLGNGYETMIFIAWCILCIAFALRNKFHLFVAFGFLLSGFTLLVAHLGQSNPQITTLMPVLHSPILSIHVSILMIAYALFGFITLQGCLALFLYFRNPIHNQEAIETLTVFSKLMLYPATFLMGIGIFIGAIWANISWGTYWSWDPKETWALITFLVYGAAFHTESVGKFNKPLFFHLYIVLAFATVLMTYFGVNNLLGGMHSYR
ncbi:MAG: cytochrome c biogenesis protein CcsA [Bacteroidales bacterium]|nr:cytochrome c biogenesis protein CcsA [Bacteroidales bacterium]